MKFRRVVVTGLGAITPLGNNVSDYWNNLLNGVSGAAPITRFDASKFKTQFACEVKGFNPEDYLDRKEARKLDPFSQYGLCSAIQAVKDAGLDGENAFDPDRVGVIWGSGIGGLQTFQDECFGFAKGDGTPRLLSGRKFPAPSINLQPIIPTDSWLLLANNFLKVSSATTVSGFKIQIYSPLACCTAVLFPFGKPKFSLFSISVRSKHASFFL